MTLDVVETILAYNAGREPERLAMKYERLRANPFAFLRGTCHLFHARLPKARVLAKAPRAWICGDAHLENFGSYKGDNRLVYFDLNDFDEATLAPCSWDLLRLLASVLVARGLLGLERDAALRLAKRTLAAYADALAQGKARWIERDTSRGLIHSLLGSLKDRRRVDHLDRRTERKAGVRLLRIDGKHALAADAQEYAQAEQLVRRFAATQPDPAFFEVRDVARRVAGTGSLGLERYVVLVEGKGSPDSNYLLDLKLALPSSLDPHLKPAPPRWPTPAERVVALQQREQAVAMAFLHPLRDGSRSYVLRGLQPLEDRIDLEDEALAPDALGQLLCDLAALLAWAHLRASGRQGSATADELIAFGTARKRWQGEMLEAAAEAARQVRRDWKTYCKAYDAGALGEPASAAALSRASRAAPAARRAPSA